MFPIHFDIGDVVFENGWDIYLLQTPFLVLAFQSYRFFFGLVWFCMLPSSEVERLVKVMV